MQVESMAKLKNGATFSLRKKGSQPSSTLPFFENSVSSSPKSSQHSDYPVQLHILKESPPIITGPFLFHLAVGVGIAIGGESPAGRPDPKDSGTP